MVRAAQLEDIGAALATEARLEIAWRHVDLERDAWLVTRDAHPVAVATVRSWTPERPFSFVNVHPEHRGRGVGSGLLPLVEGRAHEIGADAPQAADVRFHQHVGERDDAGRRLLERHRYSFVRRFWAMAIDLDKEPAAPDWPDGVRVERHSEQAERAVYDALDEAFRDHWNYTPFPYDEWRAWTVDRDAFDPGLWLVARDGDEVAGASLCEVEEDSRGWVNVLGVRRPWRRHGLGLALLLESLREFHRRGLSTAGLDVDSGNPTGATRLYERAGMRVAHTSDVYEKVLREPCAGV